LALKKLAADVSSEWKRFLKFCVVGVSGIAVNLFFVWLGNILLFAALDDKVKTPLAYGLGIVVSIFTNFLLNALWTWSDVRQKGAAQFFSRLLKYYVVSAVAGVIQFAISNGLAFFMKLHVLSGQAELHVAWKLLFALVGIAVGTLINFFMNHYWTFRR
jgi:dolichol-phosphate mannosyltransferase